MNMVCLQINHGKIVIFPLWFVIMERKGGI